MNLIGLLGGSGDKKGLKYAALDNIHVSTATLAGGDQEVLTALSMITADTDQLRANWRPFDLMVENQIVKDAEISLEARRVREEKVRLQREQLALKKEKQKAAEEVQKQKAAQAVAAAAAANRSADEAKTEDAGQTGDESIEKLKKLELEEQAIHEREKAAMEKLEQARKELEELNSQHSFRSQQTIPSFKPPPPPPAQIPVYDFTNDETHSSSTKPPPPPYQPPGQDRTGTPPPPPPVSDHQPSAARSTGMPPPPPSAAASASVPPPPPPAGGRVDEVTDVLASEGWIRSDIKIVLEVLGPRLDKARQALMLMRSLREEGYDRSSADWTSWLLTKYF